MQPPRALQYVQHGRKLYLQWSDGTEKLAIVCPDATFAAELLGKLNTNEGKCENETNHIKKAK